jgi:two-component system sensor histidine kinase ChvG
VGEAELGHLFDRYYSSRPTAGPGAPTEGDRSDHFGIGLWIVRRNVEALGGRVYAENRQPSGLRVAVILPLAK